MRKMIDPELRTRAVRLVTEHRGQYPSLTVASAAVAKQLGVGQQPVRRWVVQADVDAGGREGSPPRSRTRFGSCRPKTGSYRRTWRS